MADDDDLRDEAGRLKKGAVLNPKGRPKGTPNKMTKDLKTMIDEALQRAGADLQEKKPKKLADLEPGIAYLVHQAHRRPELFISLLKQTMPAKFDVEVNVMTQAMVGMLHERRQQLAELREMRDVTPKETEHVSD